MPTRQSSTNKTHLPERSELQRPALPPPMLHPPNIWYLKGRKMARWNLPSRRAITEVHACLSRRLDFVIPTACTHHRGHGGLKEAVRQVRDALPRAGFVARFDIASYYKSMRHDVLLAQLARAGATEKEDGGREMAVARDYLRLPDRQGSGRGMVAGGSLSPLFGSLYLAGLDRAMMARQHDGKLICYVRYMDDIVLLTETRWQLRRAIAHLHAILLPLHLRLHRVKRFIGKTSRDFDFLGYIFNQNKRLRPSAESLRRFHTRARRLYEREGDVIRLRQYVVRWCAWLYGGLGQRVSRKGGYGHYTAYIFKVLGIPRPRGKLQL